MTCRMSAGRKINCVQIQFFVQWRRNSGIVEAIAEHDSRLKRIRRNGLHNLNLNTIPSHQRPLTFPQLQKGKKPTTCWSGNDSYRHPFCRFLRQNAGHHHRRLRFLQRSSHPLHHHDGRHVLLDRTYGNRRKIRHPENGSRPPFPSDPFPVSGTAKRSSGRKTNRGKHHCKCTRTWLGGNSGRS